MYLHNKYREKSPASQRLEDAERCMVRLAAKITSAAKNRSTIGWKTVKVEIAGEHTFKALAQKHFSVPED